MTEGSCFSSQPTCPACRHILGQKASLFFPKPSTFATSASFFLLQNRLVFLPRTLSCRVNVNRFSFNSPGPALPWVSHPPLALRWRKGESTCWAWAGDHEEQVAVPTRALVFIPVTQATEPNSSLFSGKNGDVLHEGSPLGRPTSVTPQLRDDRPASCSVQTMAQLCHLAPCFLFLGSKCPAGPLLAKSLFSGSCEPWEKLEPAWERSGSGPVTSGREPSRGRHLVGAGSTRGPGEGETLGSTCCPGGGVVASNRGGSEQQGVGCGQSQGV